MSNEKISKGRGKRGPKEDRLKIESDWEDAVKDVLRKPDREKKRDDAKGEDK